MNEPILLPDEYNTFDIYFATIVGMNNHPGQKRDPVQRISINDCAKQALEMIGVRRAILNEGVSNE